MKKSQLKKQISTSGTQYNVILGDISHVIESARGASVRAINAAMTAGYWLIGQRIVEFEQKGEKRAGYGEELLERLSADLSKCYGRGFGVVNLSQMKKFYLLWPRIFQTPSEKSSVDSEGIIKSPSRATSLHEIAKGFPNKVMASEYRTALPREKALVAEIDRTRKSLGLNQHYQSKQVATMKKD